MQIFRPVLNSPAFYQKYKTVNEALQNTGKK